MVAESSVRIKKGSVLIYRIFDVAEEINMAQMEPILRDSRGPDRFNVPKFIDRAIVMRKPPVTFGLGEEAIRIKSREVKADVIVKVRDFGVLSIIYQIHLTPGTKWNELIQLASELEEGSEIDVVANRQAQEVSSQIKAAMKKPNVWSSFEDYIVYFIEEFEGDLNTKELLDKADVPALLLAEDKAVIADVTRKSLIENIYQYSEKDMALIEWNCALVVEPGGGREIPDILEFAVTQLMEMRYYDDLLDSRLQLLYDNIEKRRTSIWSTRYDRVYQESSTRYIEFIEFIERVENSLKVVGDFYLATIYRAATRRFRLSDWQNSVTRKMNILAQVSNLLQGEINTRKGHILEITIIVLITYEILSAFWKS
jgi:hypothetical protein